MSLQHQLIFPALTLTGPKGFANVKLYVDFYTGQTQLMVPQHSA